jgi:hypothetical protein
MRRPFRSARILLSLVIGCPFAPEALAQTAPAVDHRVLATSKTSTMEKELNEAAEAGFRFQSVMGGESAFGGKEVVVIMSRPERTAAGRFGYRLLATSKTSTMQKELQDAADAGYVYKDQTIFQSAFGGDEVVVILERDKDAVTTQSEYKLLATSKSSTLQKEVQQAGAAGYEVVGMTLSKTALGGKELVAILKRSRAEAAAR